MKVQNFNYFNGAERTGSAQNAVQAKAEDFDISFQQTNNAGKGTVDLKQASSWDCWTPVCVTIVLSCICD